jgi:hypothetical protein
VELHSRAIYYALDSHPRCVAQLKRSIASVRRHCRLPIYVVWAGAPGAHERAFLEDQGVTWLPTRALKRMSPTFLKWRALVHELPATDLLYLDTDTVALGDVERLFELAPGLDFQARREIASEDDAACYPYMVNAMFVGDSQLDHALYAAVCASLGARVLPLWNSGVMLLRRGLGARVGRCWDDFVRLHRLLCMKRLPYPCRNAHILEEVVAALVLGTLPELSWGLLPRDVAPWFLEYIARDGPAAPLVVHTWNSGYVGYLCHSGDHEGLRAYLALPGGGPPKPRLETLLLTLGTTVRRVPPWALARWVRHGGRSFRRDARPYRRLGQAATG